MNKTRFLKNILFGVLAVSLLVLPRGEAVWAQEECVSWPCESGSGNCEDGYCCVLPGGWEGHYCYPQAPNTDACIHACWYNVPTCSGGGETFPGKTYWWRGVACGDQGDCPDGESLCFIKEWSDCCGNYPYQDGCWCGGGCFPAGTAIKTGAGQSKEIQDLSVGDSVVSFNTETGEEEPATVEDIYQVEREGYYLVKVRDLATGEIKSLEVTGEHPLYAAQPEEQEPEAEPLLSRLFGFVEKLASFLVDLIR